MPDVSAKLANLNMEAVGSTPEEFAAVIRRDWDKWGSVVKASGLRKTGGETERQRKRFLVKAL